MFRFYGPEFDNGVEFRCPDAVRVRSMDNAKKEREVVVKMLASRCKLAAFDGPLDHPLRHGFGPHLTP